MFNRIKLIPAVILLITTSVANAGTMGDVVRNGGFYIGAGLGPDTVDFNQRSNVVIPGGPGFPPSENIINKVHLSGIGIFGTLYVGVEHLFLNQYYLAAEINGNISSLKHTESNYEFVHSSFSDTYIKIKNSFGISLLPGLQYNSNTLFYGRLGYANSLEQQTTTDVSLANFSHRLNGFRYGLGIKQAITDRFSVRLEYDRIRNNNIIESTFTEVAKITQLVPNQQLVEFGLIYSFA